MPAQAPPSRGAAQTLAAHWPEYAIEAAALAAFMVSACVFGVLLAHPASLVRQAVPSGFLRGALGGVAMGLTAIAIIYSPWGKQSGAHLNPAVTLTFLRLGKVRGWDALFYVVAQFLGGIAGVALAAQFLMERLADRNVRYVVTTPGPSGQLAAFAAELAITFGLMSAVLYFSNHQRLNRFTGLVAGVLVATYIALEAPLSGMSMNPARTFGSAFAAGIYDGLWIYFTAPLLGMLLAAESYLWRRGRAAVSCAKLQHNTGRRCIFCGAHGGFLA
jgi:aquaporin Z